MRESSIFVWGAPLELEELEQRYQENPAQWFAALADQYRKVGQLKQALKILSAGVAVRPNYSNAHVVLGRCLINLAKYDQAAKAFTRVLELESDNIIALQTLGRLAEHRGDIEGAKRWLRRLLEVDAMNTEAQLALQRLSESEEVTSEATGIAAPVAAGPEPGAVTKGKRTATKKGKTRAAKKSKKSKKTATKKGKKPAAKKGKKTAAKKSKRASKG